jgi:imidazolonepropionase-like amidohydrolase
MAYGTDVIDEVGKETRGTLSISGIDVWSEAGIPAKVLLQAMTMNAARLLGVEKERGAIRTGMAADIIATAGNPLDDASVLKKVVFVMKNGVAVKQ